MNRRSFIRGTISVMAVAAVLKGRVGEPETGFGFAPIKQEGASVAYDTHDDMLDALSQKYAKALSDSMIQTREHMAARVYTRHVYPTQQLHFTVLEDEIEPTLYHYVSRWDRIKRAVRRWA